MRVLLGRSQHILKPIHLKHKIRHGQTTQRGTCIAAKHKRGVALEIWQMAIGLSAICVPAIFTVMARDRSLMTMISEMVSKADEKIRRESEILNDRVSRVRDEHVRREDFNLHVDRTDRQFAELKADLKHGQAEINKRLDEIIRHVK